MIRVTETLEQAKERIKGLLNQNVEVTFNMGRNKYQTYNGILKNVYPALFTVMPQDKSFKGKTSYSYSEYLCGKVKLTNTNTIS